MELGSKYWLELGEDQIFGKGAVQLLQKVEELGSLRKASISLNMSYTQAWHMISAIEGALGCKILDKRIGGKKGGSSTLTAEAKSLISGFIAMEAELKTNAEHIYSKFFE